MYIRIHNLDVRECVLWVVNVCGAKTHHTNFVCECVVLNVYRVLKITISIPFVNLYMF